MLDGTQLLHTLPEIRSTMRPSAPAFTLPKRERDSCGLRGLAHSRQSGRNVLSSGRLPDLDFNGDAIWTLPIPARFVIGRQGITDSAKSDPARRQLNAKNLKIWR